MTSLPDKRPEPQASGTSWRTILGAAVVLYALIFLILNTDQVKVSFVFFTAETSLVVLILLSMGLGALIALFGPAYWRRRQRRQQESSSPS